MRRWPMEPTIVKDQPFDLRTPLHRSSSWAKNGQKRNVAGPSRSCRIASLLHICADGVPAADVLRSYCTRMRCAVTVPVYWVIWTPFTSRMTAANEPCAVRPSFATVTSIAVSDVPT